MSSSAVEGCWVTFLDMVECSCRGSVSRAGGGLKGQGSGGTEGQQTGVMASEFEIQRSSLEDAFSGQSVKGNHHKGGKGLYYNQTGRVGTQALPAATEEEGRTLEEVELETRGRSNDVELETTAVPLKATVSFPTVKLPLRKADAEAIGGAADER